MHISAFLFPFLLFPMYCPSMEGFTPFVCVWCYVLPVVPFSSCLPRPRPTVPLSVQRHSTESEEGRVTLRIRSVCMIRSPVLYSFFLDLLLYFFLFFLDYLFLSLELWKKTDC